MSSVRCHYDVLGIPRDADATTIKKAYRKLALQYHPDKNLASSSSSTDRSTLEQLFLQVQQAYECLSDIAERKWYDDHRDAILKGWSVGTTTDATHPTSTAASSTTGDRPDDIVFNVAPYMYAGCYYGFDTDHPNSFYNVYQKVFCKIYQEEVHGCDSHPNNNSNSSSNEVEYLNVPFGNGTSSYDTVVMKFYQAWESFSSVLTYAWADQWNVREAEQRRVRRAMEEDNLRSRRKARKIRNDEIAALVRFVKRRDPRIMAKKEEMEHARLLREYELKEVTKQRKLEKELANRTWREQAEQEALAMEEDDRINGRVRLADLQEDDYDYYGGGGGKKKKRGKGSKKVRDDDHKEPETINSEQPPPLDQQDPSIPISEMDQLNLATEGIPPGGDDDDPELSLDVPSLSPWRCECCVGQFPNEMEMMQHFKTKAHKDIAAMRKSSNVDQPGLLKKTKRKTPPIVLPSAGVAGTTTAQNAIASSSFEPDDTPTEEEDNDDDDDDDDDVSNHNHVLDDDDDDDDEPLYWRCECCQKDFQSEGQMENHMNSKKHKAMYRKYEKEVGKKLLYEVVEEMATRPTTST